MVSEASILGLLSAEAREQFWRGLFDIHLDPLAFVDVHYRIVCANRALAVAMGCRPEELAGRFCYEVFHNYSSPAEECPHARLLCDGCAHAGELFISALGGVHWISVTPVFDTEGALVGSLHIARNVSRYKSLEAELREARDAMASRADAQARELKQHVRFEQLLVSFAQESARACSESDLRRLILAGVSEISKAGGYARCVFWQVGGGVASIVANYEERSDGSFGALGDVPSEEEIVGWLARGEQEGFVDHVGGCDRCVAIVPAIQPGTMAFVLEVEYRQAPVRAAHMSMTPERLRLFCGAFGTALWRHASRMEMQSMRDDMQRLDRISRMGQLTAMLAHEVNQPLAATLCNAQAAVKLLALTPPDVDEARSALADIVENARSAGAVIQRTRKLFKGEYQPLRKVDLLPLVERTLALLHNEVALVDAVVDSVLDAALPHVWGDDVQLQQVLVNLLVNALDAVRTKPKEERLITIRAGTFDSGNRVVLTVQDSGVGILQGQEELIFVSFHTTKPDGMGMGLAICKQIVESFGGSIIAERVPEGGTRFLVSLQSCSVAPK